ncbi:MAG: TRAP transporter substrate-binding protein DctP [Firmicutes bacterium]|nr:TRAP transporter substrate-binding protein DctP [Bacillota bacterium]
MKKVLAVLLCLTLVFTMFACGNGDDEKGSDNQGAAGEGPTADNPVTLKCATLFAEGHPVVDRMKVFADKIAEETGGAINIKIYPSDSLGDSTACFEEVMKGTIDMTFNAGNSTYDERFMLPLLQYLASGYDEAEVMYGPDSWMHNLLAGLSEKQNLKFLGFDFVGVGGIGSTKEIKDYTKWGADKGVLLRCAPMDICSKWAEAMGFRTVSINYSDLYTSMQTGVCDAWSGGQPTVNYLSFGDVIKYYVQDDDFFELNGIYVNMDLWNTFSAEQQEVFVTAAKELYVQSLADLKEDTDYYLDEMEKSGIKVVRLSDEEKAEIAKKTREEVWPYFEESMGKETFDEMFAAYDFLND